MKEREISSSLVKGGTATLHSTFSSSDIIERYKIEIGLNVSEYFQGSPVIGLYKCNTTGFLFYSPFNLAGDGVFYSELSKKTNGYYSSNKKEFEIAIQHLASADKVLEIGCGSGFFLDILKKKGFDNICGLELNEVAVEEATKRGHKVLLSTAEKLLLSERGSYDAVAMFQVLEHVTDVSGILEAAIGLLKSKGKLIIAVPYNNPFYAGYDKQQTMNLPPHHMGLWSPESLRNLCRIFPLEVSHYDFELMPTENILYKIKSTIKNIAYGRVKMALQDFRCSSVYFFEIIMRVFTKGKLYNNQIFIFTKK